MKKITLEEMSKLHFKRNNSAIYIKIKELKAGEILFIEKDEYHGKTDLPNLLGSARHHPRAFLYGEKFIIHTAEEGWVVIKK